MARSVLALDLATRTGWAFYKEETPAPLYGSIDLSGGDEGDILNRFGRWLHGRLTIDKPTMIAFEAPFVQNASTAERLFGLAALTQFLARNNDRTAYATTPGQWRKHFLGSAHGKRAELKAATIDACKLRGWAPKTEDAADALGLLDYACQKWGLAVPWPLSPVEAAAVRATA